MSFPFFLRAPCSSSNPSPSNARTRSPRHRKNSARPATGNGARQCSVTLDQFCDKLRNQRGRCFYSGHSFFWPEKVNEIYNYNTTFDRLYAVMSLERKENDKEYTDDNTVVVIRVLNTPWTFTRAELVQIKAACKAKAAACKAKAGRG